MKVWMDGGLVAPEKAQVSVLDHGLLYGDGVFEGIGANQGRVVDLELHLERMTSSARSIDLELPPREQLRAAVLTTFAAHGKPKAYARLVVTRGVGKLGLDPRGCKSSAFCIVDSLCLFPNEDKGLHLIVATRRRPDADVLDPAVKSLNYLNNVLAKQEALRAGADDALLLNSRGTIAEASAANLFVRRGDSLTTPPTSDGALGGITRRRILHLAPRLGLNTEEAPLTRHDLLCADEAILCGTGAGLAAVKSLDGQLIAGAQESTAPPLVERFRPLFTRYAKACGCPIPGLAN